MIVIMITLHQVAEHSTNVNFPDTKLIKPIVGDLIPGVLAYTFIELIFASDSEYTLYVPHHARRKLN